MKRRNVNALAPCLLAVLMAATVAFVGLSADAASGKQEAAYEAMAVVNTQGAANLTTGKFAGIASIVNDQEAYTGNRSLKEDIDYQAVKAVTGISGDDVDKRLSEAETGAAKTQQEKEAAWEGRTIASNVEEYVYVRAEADENSDVVGKLVKGAAGDVLEKGDQWTRISSGEVEGYVSNDYLAFGAEALEVAEAVCNYVAVADADMISIRQEPKDDAQVLSTVSTGEKFEVVEDGSDWVKVVAGDDYGFMSKEVVNVRLDLAVATPVEPERTETPESAEKESAADDRSSADSESGGEKASADSETKEQKKQESAAKESDAQEVSSGGSASHSGTFKVTAYCACSKCCGSYANGITATGTRVTAGKTIAVDKNVIPLGTTVYIDGVPYVAEDTGVHGNAIDLYMDSHSAALQWGVKYCTVTW